MFLLLLQILIEEKREIKADTLCSQGGGTEAQSKGWGPAGGRGAEQRSEDGRPCLSRGCLAAGSWRQRGLWRASPTGLRSQASFQFPASRPQVPNWAHCPGCSAASRAGGVHPKQLHLRCGPRFLGQQGPCLQKMTEPSCWAPSPALPPQPRPAPAQTRLKLPASQPWAQPRIWYKCQQGTLAMPLGSSVSEWWQAPHGPNLNLMTGFPTLEQNPFKRPSFEGKGTKMNPPPKCSSVLDPSGEPGKTPPQGPPAVLGLPQGALCIQPMGTWANVWTLGWVSATCSHLQTIAQSPWDYGGCKMGL